ncbi:Translocation protein S62 [Malassezia cuniculi]|uniref:Translocation protein SEC62 n=1 Tax=Malassezia cuniculi TaxID=948313 RepID=A0AAF0EQE7_9BASI|nr:Translocation protein S62 [Malassezia cuniculi]
MIVNFLRNNAGIKTRVGILNGKRVDYFKGSAAIKAVRSPEFARLKNTPSVPDDDAAERMLHSLLPFAFFLRVDRGDQVETRDGNSAYVVQVNQMQTFEPDLYYAWFYEGSQLGLRLAGLGMVALILAGVMFPLWPQPLRLGVWYLSLGVLGLFGLLMVIAVIRLIFWIITIVVVPPGIWIFPNLFADVGFVESFIPLWAWDEATPKKAREPKPKKGKKKGKSRAEKAPVADSAAADAADAPVYVSETAAQESASDAAAPAPAAESAFDDVN